MEQTEIEKKAEEILQTKGSVTFCAKGCGYTEKVIELIALGIAEGRKGKCLEQNNDGTIRPCEVMKENAELKAKLKEGEVFIENIVKASADNPNEFFELRKENKELKEQNELLTKRITELQADKGRLIDENSLARVLIDRCKELGIKDLYHLKDLLELAESLRCCGNCSEPCWDFPIVRKSECLSNDYSLWEQIK